LLLISPTYEDVPGFEGVFSGNIALFFRLISALPLRQVFGNDQGKMLTDCCDDQSFHMKGTSEEEDLDLHCLLEEACFQLFFSLLQRCILGFSFFDLIVIVFNRKNALLNLGYNTNLV
jgi:hypothetical protein